MKNKVVSFTFTVIIGCILSAFAVGVTRAQTAVGEPEMSVVGLRLGDEESGKKILQNYSPRYDNGRNQPKYFFYNGYGNQVMTVTAYSKERPYLIIGVEVFAVGESYQKKHFQMKEFNSFMSESGFFIGARPSATSLIFAIPNVTRPKEVINKKGQPQADEKSGKVRTLKYQIESVKELESREANLRDVDFGNYTGGISFL